MLLLDADGRFASGDLGLFLGELSLVTATRVGDQRRRQGLRELDLGSAIWAGQGWVDH
jgi:hypothetical protein